jgi:hypothetical protein
MVCAFRLWQLCWVHDLMRIKQTGIDCFGVFGSYGEMRAGRAQMAFKAQKAVITKQEGDSWRTWGVITCRCNVMLLTGMNASPEVSLSSGCGMARDDLNQQAEREKGAPESHQMDSIDGVLRTAANPQTRHTTPFLLFERLGQGARYDRPPIAGRGQGLECWVTRAAIPH